MIKSKNQSEIFSKMPSEAEYDILHATTEYNTASSHSSNSRFRFLAMLKITILIFHVLIEKESNIFF